MVSVEAAVLLVAVAGLSVVFWLAARDNAAVPIMSERPSAAEVMVFMALISFCEAFSFAFTDTDGAVY